MGKAKVVHIAAGGPRSDGDVWAAPTYDEATYCGAVGTVLVAARFHQVTCKSCLRRWRVRGGGQS